MRRSMLFHGLKITLSRPRAVLWTYAFNVGLALLFSMRLHAQLDSILTHSLASERLNSAFDLGVAASAFRRLSDHAPATGISGSLGIFFYLLLYFLLVPGTLFTYQTAAPAKLAILLSIGFQRFWRFVRIALLTGIAALILLGPLAACQNAWSNHVDATLTGYPALFASGAGLLILLLAASVIRLYFDLVEIYTIQLGEQLRPDGHPDRRIRRVLLPALRTLRQNFFRSTGTFLLLALVGFACLILAGRVALHTLAQPRVWPTFLVAQLGLFSMLFIRFWQRGAETVLVCDNPLPSLIPRNDPLLPFLVKRSKPIPQPTPTLDPLPNPEPASPSLLEPDPGVFHHDTPHT